MSGEQAETLPEDLDTWLDQRASEDEVDRDDLLVRAVAAYRILEGECETLDGTDWTRGQLAEDVDHLNARLAAVEDDVDTKIDDVRSRLVQVKREVDTKAPAEHSHPGLADRIDTAGVTATEALDRIDDLGDRLDRGFENYEEVLTYLRDTTDGLDDDVTRLAHTLVDLRGRTAALEATITRYTAAVDLKREANRHGITDATCAECDSTVHLGLLSVPRCPHCERGFVDVEPARGFFGSATLSVGNPPALDGETTPPSEHIHSEDGDV